MVESSQVYELVCEETLVELTVLWGNSVLLLCLWEEGLGSGLQSYGRWVWFGRKCI